MVLLVPSVEKRMSMFWKMTHYFSIYYAVFSIGILRDNEQNITCGGKKMKNERFRGLVNSPG